MSNQDISYRERDMDSFFDSDEVKDIIKINDRFNIKTFEYTRIIDNDDDYQYFILVIYITTSRRIRNLDSVLTSFKNINDNEDYEITYEMNSYSPNDLTLNIILGKYDINDDNVRQSLDDDCRDIYFPVLNNVNNIVMNDDETPRRDRRRDRPTSSRGRTSTSSEHADNSRLCEHPRKDGSSCVKTARFEVEDASGRRINVCGLHYNMMMASRARSNM